MAWIFRSCEKCGLVTLVVFGLIFKLLESRFKKKVAGHGAAKLGNAPDPKSLPQVAGPVDLGERESGMQRLLSAAGLPPLDEIKEFYPDSEEYEMFYERSS